MAAGGCRTPPAVVWKPDGATLGALLPALRELLDCWTVGQLDTGLQVLTRAMPKMPNGHGTVSTSVGGTSFVWRRPAGKPGGWVLWGNTANMALPLACSPKPGCPNRVVGAGARSRRKAWPSQGSSLGGQQDGNGLASPPLPSSSSYHGLPSGNVVSAVTETVKSFSGIE
jgi:hypothetical protein